MRAAIYARYSSDNQSERSIADQISLCRAFIDDRGWTVSSAYSDRAQSGSSRFRPEYQRLLADVRSGIVDIVVAEALDRLSRDQEDVAALFKALTFASVKLFTVAEGEISELHVGLKGTMNALFLKDLAAKTHRGLRGRVEQKRSAGGRCFGYQVVKESDARGEPIRGGRVIDAAEADVVVRIFEKFAHGASPRAIARSLNEAGVAGPNGGPWLDTTIRGHAARGTGILRNELYAGRLVWNRQKFVKDPATGKRISRPNPPSQWIVEPVPELRIVPDELWQAIAQRLTDITASDASQAVRESRFWEKRRPRHILTGLVTCGCCGHALAAVGRDYLRCARATRHGLCTNKESVRRTSLEGIVIEALQHNLMRPELVAEFIAAVTEELNRGRAHDSAQRTRLERRQLEVDRLLDGLITALAEGFRAPGLQARLDALEAEKADIARQLAAPAPNPVRLHPNLAEVYRLKVASLHEALHREETRAEAFDILRSLIENVVIHPREGGGVEIELIGEIASMVAVATNTNAAPGRAALDEPLRRSVKVVAGTGFEPVTFRL
ncbi:recombinase family protein [Alsobacter metallidurans]|nr:recombinase family protein [Alsobacter metallidurans]